MKKSLKALPFLAAAGLVLSAVVPAFAQEGTINVVSREDGSGTRGAFVEIVGVLNDDKEDNTTTSAVIQNSTNGVMQTVAGDPQAIGYISLGSLDDTVKAVAVDGVEVSAETITSGDYSVARPFVVAWSNTNDQSEATADFLTFIHSKEGQTIVEEEGYIAVDGQGSSETAADAESTEEASSEESTEESTEAAGSVIDALLSYEAAGLEGTIELVGSTSVTPVIEVLAEEYMALNPDVVINITSNGSSAGIEAAIAGTADLGMSSRELKDEEAEKLDQSNIALDGIAVIVNNENPATDLSLEAIKGIFLGEITAWEDAK